MNLKINIMQTIKYNKSKQQYIISTLSNNKKIINLEILTKLCNKTQSLLKLNNKWQTTSFLPNYVKINNDYYLQEFDFDYVD
jgi:outer membrane receptor for monomeric catechols|tara:strand:- start:238 stop:483 length:246 start_codon:yes stop_codon:yes gene_type:complete